MNIVCLTSRDNYFKHIQDYIETGKKKCRVKGDSCIYEDFVQFYSNVTHHFPLHKKRLQVVLFGI